MKEFSVPMALFDFIPVAMFLAAGILLQRDLYNKMSKGAFAIFSAGTIDMVAAGGLKALYKLLYALNICDFQPISGMFFPVQSLGALLAGLGIIALLVHKQDGREKLAAVAAPPVFTGTYIFVGLMVAGIGGLTFGLVPVAKKLKKPAAILLLCLSFVLMLGMGYLSSKNFDKASMNWMAEGVNFAGQAAFLSAVMIMHRAGLKTCRP